MTGLTNHHGIAMFLVLWVLALLSVIVGEYCYTMRTEVNITRNAKDGTQAYYIAEAGVKQAVFEIVAGEMLQGPGQAAAGKPGDENTEMPSPWRVNANIPSISFSPGRFKVRIHNESGKISLNQAQESLLKITLDAFDLEDLEKQMIADSIQDWRDADSFHRLNGAENDYYRSLPDPYDCKNGPFDTVEELLLVRGVTPELFYEKGLKDVLTAVVEDSSGASSGARKTFDFTKININAASDDVLRLLPLVDRTVMDAIHLFREAEDFTDLHQVAEVVGDDVFPGISPYITTDLSAYFTIESMGAIDGSSIRQTVKTLIRIDFQGDKKYRVMKWHDAVETSRDLMHDWSDEMLEDAT